MFGLKKNFLKTAVILGSVLFCGQSQAGSVMSLCNNTNVDVAFSFVYDQTTDAAKYRRGNDRYRAGGWIYIDKGQCDQGIQLGNGQYIYLAFSKRSYEGGGSIILEASGLPRANTKRVKSICTDTKAAFDISSDDLSDITTHCKPGYTRMPVSFGLRGGNGRFKINLSR